MSLKNAVAKPTVQIGPDAFDRIQSTALWWLGGAGFLINAMGTVIAIDPTLSYQPGTTNISEIGMPLLVAHPIEAAAIPRLDYVLYTHTDIDHLAPVTARILIDTEAVFIGPGPAIAFLRDMGVGEDRLRLIKAGDRLVIGSVNLRVTRADHAWQVVDPEKYGPPFGPDDCCGYVLTTPDGTVWHPGDTVLLDEHLRESDIDVLFLDISRGDFHIGTKDAARLANVLGSAQIVPHHYGCYDEPNFGAVNGDPDEVAAMIEDASTRIRVLAPGERLTVHRR